MHFLLGKSVLTISGEFYIIRMLNKDDKIMRVWRNWHTRTV